MLAIFSVNEVPNLYHWGQSSWRM